MYYAALTNRESGYYAISYQGSHNSSKSRDVRCVDTRYVYLFYTQNIKRHRIIRSELRTDRDSKITI